MTLYVEPGNGISVLTLKKSAVVFSQGNPADSIYYIHKGKVKLTVVSKEGKEAVIAVLEPGEFLGEGCLSGQTVRMMTAFAFVECQLLRLEKAAMIRLLQDEPELADRFTAHLLTRSIRIQEDLVDQLFNSSEKRLARALLLLAHFGKEARSEEITPAVSQELLAEMIGTTRARVSFFMNKFRKLGFIDYGRHRLEIHSSLLSVILRD